MQDPEVIDTTGGDHFNAAAVEAQAATVRRRNWELPGIFP